MSDHISYLGPRGTFTEMAAGAVFPNESLNPMATIPECMDSVESGEADYAVVPMENAIEGSVNLTVDYLFSEKSLGIVGEVVVPIRQHLMVHPDCEQDWRDVEVVYSHPQAIAQCHHFLRENLPNAQVSFTNSTALAAEWVKAHPEESAAAIGNSLAASTYKLRTAEQDVHDYEHNDTRFVVLHKDKTALSCNHAPHVRDKTTMTITLPHDYSGALHQVLSAFAWRHLNMTKIESRPTKTGLGNYYFIIDVEQKMDDVMVPGVKNELQALGCRVNIVGSYPCYTVEETVVSAGVKNIVGVNLFLTDTEHRWSS